MSGTGTEYPEIENINVLPSPFRIIDIFEKCKNNREVVVSSEMLVNFRVHIRVFCRGILIHKDLTFVVFEVVRPSREVAAGLVDFRDTWLLDVGTSVHL